MLSPDLHARLERLNRQPLTAARRGPAVERRNAGHESCAGVEAGVLRLAVGLEIENAAGRFLRIDRPLAELWPGGAAALSLSQNPLPSGEGRVRENLPPTVPHPNPLPKGEGDHSGIGPLSGGVEDPGRQVAEPPWRATRRARALPVSENPLPKQEGERSNRRRAEARRAELAALTEYFPGGTLFLDLETCGFAGSMIFLVGLVCRVGEELVVRQLLSRTYAEERAMLAALWPLVAENPVLCTFNGKTFDWPMIHDRSTLHRLGRVPRGTAARVAGPGHFGVELPEVDSPILAAQKLGQSPGGVLGPRQARPQPVHFDLLHHARRRWRGRLPDCRLQTLETYICRRRRSGDIAGSEIPPAYHDFVRSGEPRRMESILHHNALDLVTMVQLAERLRTSESGSGKGT